MQEINSTEGEGEDWVYRNNSPVHATQMFVYWLVWCFPFKNMNGFPVYMSKNRAYGNPWTLKGPEKTKSQRASKSKTLSRTPFSRRIVPSEGNTNPIWVILWTFFFFWQRLNYIRVQSGIRGGNGKNSDTLHLGPYWRPVFLNVGNDKSCEHIVEFVQNWWCQGPGTGTGTEVGLCSFSTLSDWTLQVPKMICGLQTKLGNSPS